MTAPKTRNPRAVPATVELPDLNGQTAGEAGDTAQPGSSDTVADLDPIFPDPSKLTILGIPATVRRLQTREIMGGIRILVDQLGTNITKLDLDVLMAARKDEDDDETKAQREAQLAEQKQNALGMLLVAAPDAIDEILKLLGGLVEAKDPAQQEILESIMFNPPPAVTLDVIGVVWDQEREDFQALVGKVRTLLGFAQALQRTGRAGT